MISGLRIFVYMHFLLREPRSGVHTPATQRRPALYLTGGAGAGSPEFLSLTGRYHAPGAFASLVLLASALELPDACPGAGSQIPRGTRNLRTPTAGGKVEDPAGEGAVEAARRVRCEGDPIETRRRSPRRRRVSALRGERPTARPGDLAGAARARATLD